MTSGSNEYLDRIEVSFERRDVKKSGILVFRKEDPYWIYLTSNDSELSDGSDDTVAHKVGQKYAMRLYPFGRVWDMLHIILTDPLSHWWW